MEERGKIVEKQQQARWLATLAATVLALYLCWLMLKPFIAVLEWAVVLVIVFYPGHQWLAKKIKRRGLSALISSLLVMVIFLAPLTFLSLALANELTNLARDLPSHAAQLLHPETPLTGKLFKWLRDYAAIDTLSSQGFVIEQLKNAGEALLKQSLGVMGNVISGIVKVFFVIFTMYYLFRDGDRIVRALPGVLPLTRQQSEDILRRTSQVVSASVYGVIAIAILQGMLGGLAFWILGVPSPILWATVLAFVCMIPIAGSFFVWLPAAIYFFTTGHWTKALLLIIWGSLVISTVDNLLRPKIIKHKTRLPELFVFFSVLGGMSVFGLLGIVLGPVVLAITLGLLQTFKQQDEAPQRFGSERAATLVELSRGPSVSPQQVMTK